ncbi:MAG: hypothetical protein AAF754_15780 [Pseudomonadota bacterium]
MKRLILFCLIALISGCDPVLFVGDSPRIQKTNQTPDYFELPARFAYAQLVYGASQSASAREAELWSELAGQAERIGTFNRLLATPRYHREGPKALLLDAALDQRFNYLLLLTMHPSTGSADIEFFHVASGGVMATATARSPQGGRNGFWGGRIRNPKRLERQTFRIAEAAMPVVVDMLNGVKERAR